jgi:hypothetical protein
MRLNRTNIVEGFIANVTFAVVMYIFYALYNKESTLQS